MKLGIVTNGISEDFRHALETMRRDQLEYADLQFIWGKEIGDHTAQELETMRCLLREYGIMPGVITRHTFNGILVSDISVGDDAYQKQIEQLKTSIAMAQFFGTKLVRILTFVKCAVLWGSDGAEQWVTNHNKNWSNFMRLLEKPLQMAEDAGVDLIMETGIFSLVNNGYIARRIIEDQGSKRLKILWDFANAAYSGEPPFPEGYDHVRDHLAHVHVKDYTAPESYKAEIANCPLGKGLMAPYLTKIADALRKDNYQGIVSFESVYRPKGGTDEDGYRQSIKVFREIFG